MTQLNNEAASFREAFDIPDERLKELEENMKNIFISYMLQGGKFNRSSLYQKLLDMCETHKEELFVAAFGGVVEGSLTKKFQRL